MNQTFVYDLDRDLVHIATPTLHVWLAIDYKFAAAYRLRLAEKLSFSSSEDTGHFFVGKIPTSV